MKRPDQEWAKWIPICIIAIVMMVIYKTIDNIGQITSAIGRLMRVISPLLYGILFAYFLYIPHQKLAKLFGKIKIKKLAKRSVGISTITVFLLLIVIISLLISFVLPIIITSIVDLARSIPSYVNALLDYLDNIPEDSIWYSLKIADTLRENASDYIYQYINISSIEQVARGVMNLADEITSMLLGLIVSLYLLLERERILKFFIKLNNTMFKSERVRSGMLKYLRQVNKVLYTFIASKGLDSIINLVVVTSILLIFNVPYAFLLGLIAGLFNFIPYLGSLVAVLLISLITLITGGLAQALQVVIPLFIFQQLDGNYIEPRIMKSSLKISPVLVIVAVIAGGAYFGIFGMFLAVPAVAIIKQILIEYVSNSDPEAT